MFAETPVGLARGFSIRVRRNEEIRTERQLLMSLGRIRCAPAENRQMCDLSLCKVWQSWRGCRRYVGVCCEREGRKGCPASPLPPSPPPLPLSWKKKEEEKKKTKNNTDPQERRRVGEEATNSPPPPPPPPLPLRKTQTSLGFAPPNP